MMRAITVRQPWAWAIAEAAALASLGIEPKLTENRGRRVSDRHIGQDIAIHAGKQWDADAVVDLRIREAWRSMWDATPCDPGIFDFSLGSVVAVARLVGCHQALRRPNSVCCRPWGDRWYASPANVGLAWHLVLADVRKLPEPVPARGQLAVPWTLPPDVAEQVAAQLAEVTDD